MPISDGQLDVVVKAWNNYAETGPSNIVPKDLLEKRDVNMYRGLGITSAGALVRDMVEHRSVATMEMAMGYLYERLLQELGPQKVTTVQKQLPGYKGVDFIQQTPNELRVINLKAGLSTSNGDITASTKRNLGEAKKHWGSQPAADDNPLAQQKAKVVMVRAVARGGRRHTETTDGITWLVGEAMWEYFGAEEGFLQRLSDALARNPLSYERYRDEKVKASDKVLKYLVGGGFADIEGQLDWGLLVAKFP